jgi:hypothetical protein
LGRGAQSFFAFPINLDRIGIKKAAVLPDPVEKISHVVVNKDARLTGLSSGYQIISFEDGWQSVALNWSGNLVTGKLNIL